jgi:hypothetical protein
VKEFSVEIGHKGNFGESAYAKLDLPATWAEFSDALQRAHASDAKELDYFDILYCEKNWLKPHTADCTNIYELNLLASRLQEHIPDELDIFEGLVRMDAARNGSHIPVSRLINMTFSTSRCMIASNIASDAELGEVLYENDLLAEMDALAVNDRMDNGRPADAMLALLGKEHREGTGGVLTDTGLYLEWDGEIEDAYYPGETVYFNHIGVPVVLELSCNEKTVELEFPLSDRRLQIALSAVDAKRLEECNYRCTDCLIPTARKWIDEAGDYNDAERFALKLAEIERNGCVPEYKALLEASGCEDLETAIRLTDEIYEYRLDAECCLFTDYAKKELCKKFPASENGVDITEYVNLQSYGKALMEQNNVVSTNYGMLSRKDGGPILFPEDMTEENGQEQSGPEMEMR